jgi:hypothetical protein
MRGCVISGLFNAAKQSNEFEVRAASRAPGFDVFEAIVHAARAAESSFSKYLLIEAIVGFLLRPILTVSISPSLINSQPLVGPIWRILQ